MNHGEDWRWTASAPDYRPSIRIIEPPARQPGPAEHHAGNVERVPFGFGRVLAPTGSCGIPRKGRPHLGGCELRIGHPGAHRYRTQDPAPIRPGATPV